MSRLVFVIPILAFALQVSQAQISSHGAPAAASTTSTSPTAEGHQHGATASVFTPSTGVHQPLRPGVRVHGPVRRFGNQHIRQQVFVPIPLFYPAYGYGYGDSAYPSTADPSVADTQAQADPTQANPTQANPTQANPAQTNATQPSQGTTDQNEDQLRAAYLQGAHDAMTRQDQGDSRYGEHYMDSRERSQQEPSANQKSPDNTKAEFSMVPPEDKSPATVFIFKDGHQLETKNYAIMGGTLFDFSGKLVKKIQLDDLDPTATVKANDDRGVQVKLP